LTIVASGRSPGTAAVARPQDTKTPPCGEARCRSSTAPSLPFSWPYAWGARTARFAGAAWPAICAARQEG